MKKRTILHKGEHVELTYDPKLAMLRIFVLLIIIFLCVYFLFFNKDDTSIDNISNKIKDQITVEEFRYNSRGSFISTDESIKVQGLLEINKNRIFLNDFKVTKKPNTYLVLSNSLVETNPQTISIIEVNIGNLEFKIPAEINQNNYKYLLIWGKDEKKTYAYTEIN